MRQTCGLDIKVTLHSVQWAKQMVKDYAKPCKMT